MNDVVPILFQTKHGREIEAITLDSVKMLMHDMEAEAVPKQEFVLLKTTLAKLPSDTVRWALVSHCFSDNCCV